MASKKTSEEQLPVSVGDVPQELIAMMEAGEIGDSLETLRHHRILNRLKVVQGMSKREVKAKYGEGSIIIPVTESLIAKVDGKVDFVPVMFFDEFISWNDRDDTASPKIHDKSLDLAGKIAVLSASPTKRSEKYGDNGKGGQFVRKHTHHLNFLVVLYSGDLKGTLCVLSFSRGEFSKGLGFVGMVKSQRVKTATFTASAPLWSQVWTMSVGPRKNDKGEWWGVDIAPADNPRIANDDVRPFKTMHEELLKDYREQLLVVGHEAAEDDEMGPDLAASKDM